MTAVVGLVEQHKRRGSRVWLGADAVAGETDHYRVRLVQPKVFSKGPYTIGYTTSFRMGQVLQHVADLPLSKTGPPFLGHMVKTFVPAVMAEFGKSGWLYTDKDRKHGGEFLVGIGGELFEVGSDFSVLQKIDFNFSAVGCGVEYLLGSLHSTRGRPRARITEALAAAAAFSAYVRPPYTILNGGWFK